MLLKNALLVSKYSIISKNVVRFRGIFNIDLLHSLDTFPQLNEEVRSAAATLVQRIERGDPNRSTVQLFDDLSNEICCAADAIECIRQMHSDDSTRAAAEASAHDFCDLVESLNTRQSLYQTLKIAKERETQRMDDVDSRTLDLFLDDFEQSGVHLDNDRRRRFVELSTKIFYAGARFQELCDRTMKISARQRHIYNYAGNVLYGPSLLSSSYEKRKFSYNTYMARSDDQEENLRNLLGTRHELAILTGFPSYAHRAQFNTILGNFDSVKGFLENLIDDLRPVVVTELDRLASVREELNYEHSDGSKIGEWDIQFLSGVYRQSHYQLNFKKHVEPFFTIGHILNAFETIVHNLYNIRFEYPDIVREEIWPGVVFKIRVFDAQDNVLGDIFLDVEQRDTKAVGDCHYTVRCSKHMPDGTWQQPIVVLSLSLAHSACRDWRTVPITVSQADNLFHEMGHAMHSMLGRTRFQHVAGTRCPQDMAEVPSNVMERFFNCPVALAQALRDHNGNYIAQDTAKILSSSRAAFSGIELTQQASYALFDLEAHSKRAPEIAQGQLSSTDLMHSIQEWALPNIAKSPTLAFHEASMIEHHANLTCTRLKYSW